MFVCFSCHGRCRWDTCPSKIGGEGGTRTPMPVRTSVFKTDAMTVLPPLHSAGLSPLVTFAKVGACRSQRSARLNGLPAWTRTGNHRINSEAHYHCATLESKSSSSFQRAKWFFYMCHKNIQATLLFLSCPPSFSSCQIDYASAIHS